MRGSTTAKVPPRIMVDKDEFYHWTWSWSEPGLLGVDLTPAEQRLLQRYRKVEGEAQALLKDLASRQPSYAEFYKE